jgi:tripartite-type tricarboxylate transporter receptor subunit TctC
VATVMLGSGELGRPVVTSPGTPADRTQLLRDAFIKSMNDAALLDEAKQKKLDITPVGGEELAKIARDVIDQPADVIERIRKILAR